MASFVLAKKWAKNWLSRKKCFVAKKSGQLANFAKKSGQKICQFFGQKSGKNGIFGLFLGLFEAFLGFFKVLNEFVAKNPLFFFNSFFFLKNKEKFIFNVL